MKDRFEHLEQEKRINDIVVDNVDTSEMNDPNKHLQELINTTLMGVIVSDNELINTTVIKKRGSDKMTLIGKLKSIATKKAILQQKKMFVKKRLFVKENLTPYKYGIFKSAKEIARKEGYKFVWTRDGNVFIRRDENSNPIQLRNKGMLSVL